MKNKTTQEIRKIKVPRWYLAYVFLVAFDVATVSISIWLTHTITEIFFNSVEVNKEWAVRAQNLSDLRSIASLVNAPGNEVFNSHDVLSEKSKLELSIKQYAEKKEQIRQDLINNVEANTTKNLLANMENIQVPLDKMIEETLIIFSNIQNQNPKIAAEHMTVMDRKFSLVNQAFANFEADLRGIQNELFTSQQVEAKKMQEYELIIASLILFMVLGATIYGHKIYKSMKISLLEREKLLQDIVNSEKTIRSIIESAVDGIATINEQETIQTINTSFLQLFGYDDEEEVIGKNISSFISNPYKEKYDEYNHQKLGIKKIIGRGKEVVGLKKDGSTFPFYLSVSEFYLEEEKMLAGIVHDLTVQKATENNLIKAKNSAELAKNEAVEANQAKSQFLSSMSHELRTPLNAILGFGQLMQMEHKETHQSSSEDISEILKAGNHLLQLINDVLDLAKVEAGAISLSLEPVNVKSVIDECFKLSSSLAIQNNISLNKSLDSQENSSLGSENTVVMADRLRLKQVLLNLITNAIKYNTEEGHVTVICQTVEQDNKIRITIDDTGIGLNEKQQKKIFTAFERLGAENSSVEGSGIGLVLSKQLIEEMEGSISFKSQVGIGSQFWIELPKVSFRTSSRDEYSDDISKVRGVSEQDPDRQKTVLYIEDNPSNLLVMERIFKSRFPQWQLVPATEPRSGLSMANDLQPDLILLDINLPVMDGYAVFKQLKQSKVTSQIPVIAVTALAMETDIEKSKNIGFDDYITKPVDVELLTKSLNRIFSEH